jgi:alpha-1,3-rhamnosyl/mannosyltransferase
LRRVAAVPGRAVQGAWKTLYWPPFDWFAGRHDVTHFPNFFLPPLRRGRSAVTIHDVSFLRHPEFTESGNLRFLRTHIRRTAARADAIITDSRFSADEIAELLNVAPDRLHPIHLGIDPGFRRPSDEALAAARGRLALDAPYLLTVGTVEPRKNIAFLVEVFERLAGFDGLLVIAGMRGWQDAPILRRLRESPRAASIRHLDYVPDADLPALYAGAELFLTASFYEGFGLPPLEAMACGTPVVASDGGALAEVLGAAAVLRHGFDVDDWVAAVREVLTDSGRRDELRRRGLDRAAGFRWEQTARSTWEVYRGLCGCMS